MPTVEDAKSAKRGLEEKIRELLSDYESNHDVSVDSVRLHHLTHADGRSTVGGVSLDVSL